MAAAGDLHCRDDHQGRFQKFVQQVNAQADLLVLCGDLTDRGWASEGKVLAGELSALRVPCVVVLGNHDYEGGAAKDICAELTRVGVHCLDGNHFLFDKVLGVAGVKGFAGGFGNATLQAFGEGLTKSFVQEAVTESLKLEAALAKIEVAKKVVIMHYAPVVETIHGENVEIFPFLGTSRLAMPVDHFGAACVFHGHAHHGSHEGKTKAGIPVYNVAMPLMARLNPDQRFKLVEV
ncbi:MAG: metallophosphoesterase [Myxococcaceae bacterium]|nr:metallophosphoesterase [Myxococcaceae bacterium]MCI0671514.1 metallophosphoesterase [Myxococcaceae bacterium]